MKNLLLFFIICSYYLEGASRLSVVGATTVQPIIEQVAEQYKKETGIILNIQGGGTKFGIDSVKMKTADVGMMNRALNEEEKEQVAHLTIAYDSLVFIVNESNGVDSLTSNQVIDIFSGKIKNWKHLSNIDDTIILISKDPGRGTMQNFSTIFRLYHPLDKKNRYSSKMIPASAWDARGNNDSLVWTGGLRNVIAFVSFGSATQSIKNQMPIKILKLDNVIPKIETIASNKYPIRLELNVVYDKENIEAKKFVHWLLGEYAQDVVEKNVFIKVK
jgi:phosphate transport system substrate-binding protein